MTQFMSQIRTFIAATIPFTFNAIEVIIGFVSTLLETDIVEEKKTQPRSDKTFIRDAGPLQYRIALRAMLRGSRE